MSKLGSIKLGLGKTQKQIVEYLLSVGGATCTWDMQTSVAQYPSGHLAVSRAAWRLENRGMLKRVIAAIANTALKHGHISERELHAARAAAERHPKAWVFWVLSDAAMDVIGEQE